MDLQHLATKNWLALRLVDLDLASHKAHLFAGLNEAGKTSLRDAIRFLIRGDCARVKLKRDYDFLITHGAKGGKVSGIIDGAVCERTVRDAKESGGPFPQIPEQLLDIALGFLRFTELKDVERRQLLFTLAGVHIKPDDVAERLKKRGIPESMLVRVRPMLRAGLEAVVREAKSKASEATGAWRAATGEVYGSTKAETWAATPPPAPVAPEGYDPKQAADHLKEHMRLEGKRDDHIGRRATIEQGLTEAKRAAARRTELLDAASTLTLANSELLQARKSRAAKAEQSEKLMRDWRVATARELLCPHCESYVKLLEDGSLAKSKLLPTGTDVAAWKREADGLEAMLPTLDLEISGLEKKVSDARKDLDEYNKLLTVASVDVAQKAFDDIVARIVQDDAQLKKLDDAEAQNIAYAAALSAHEGLVTKARQLTDDAAGFHREAVQWSAVAEALSPDGIPSEYLGAALASVNDALAVSALSFGDEPPRIREDMEVVRAETPYGLLSESARYRVDLFLQEVVCYLAKVGFMVVDRVDVLDTVNRGRFINWLDGIVQDRGFNRVLCMGTFARAPGGADFPSSIKVHWMEGGEIRSQLAPVVAA